MLEADVGELPQQVVHQHEAPGGRHHRVVGVDPQDVVGRAGRWPRTGADPQGQGTPTRVPGASLRPPRARRPTPPPSAGRRAAGDAGLGHRVRFDQRHRRQRAFTHDHRMDELDRDVMGVRLPLRERSPTAWRRRGTVGPGPGAAKVGQSRVDETLPVCSVSSLCTPRPRPVLRIGRTRLVDSISLVSPVCGSCSRDSALSWCASLRRQAPRTFVVGEYAAHPIPVRGHHVAPGRGAGASERRPWLHRTRSAPARQARACRRRGSGARQDHHVVIPRPIPPFPNGCGSPAAPSARLCVAIEESHPGVDHEDVKLWCASEPRGWDQVAEQSGGLTLERPAQPCPAGPGRRGPAADRRPSSCAHIGVERIADAGRVGDRPQIRPRAVELLGMATAELSAQQPSASPGPQ